MQSLTRNKSGVPLSLESAWLDKHILREYYEVTDQVDLPFGVDSSLSETTANWQMAFTPDLGMYSWYFPVSHSFNFFRIG